MTSSRAERLLAAASSRAPRLSDLQPEDLAGVLALNNASVPHVNELDADRLNQLVEMSSLAIVARRGGALAGFAIVMAPGLDYDSPNYRYFEQHLDGFRYLDRIAVDPSARRLGIGRVLYDAVFEHARAAGATRVVCEVNIEPPNPGSQAFHRSLGFVGVGRQSTYGGSVVVQMLVAELDRGGFT